MRGFKMLVVPLLLVLSCALVPAGPALSADKEETPEIKQNVHFVSIEAKTVVSTEAKTAEDETEIKWVGTFSVALKGELKKIAAKKGYTFFRIVKDGTIKASTKTRVEYRLDDKRDYYFQPILDSVKTWQDHNDEEHKYVEISGPIVLRKDNQDKLTAKVKFGREIGSYFAVIFVKFYKHEDIIGNVTKTDLILAIAPKK